MTKPESDTPNWPTLIPPKLHPLPPEQEPPGPEVVPIPPEYRPPPPGKVPEQRPHDTD